MIAFYVQGGGLGHLTRTNKLIKSLNLPIKDIVVITPSAFTHFFDFKVVQLDWNDKPSNWSTIVLSTFKKYKIKTCYVDAFPFGLKGELLSVYENVLDVEFQYVSRVLKWATYLNDIKADKCPSFSKTIVLERLYEDHLLWIKKNSFAIVKQSLSGIKISAEKPLIINKPYALVVHSGGLNDVLTICKYAEKELRGISNINILICTQITLPKLSEKFKVLHQMYPVSDYYTDAFKIYTAAGFNVMSELAHFKNKHVAIPLDRKYDDQFFRLKNH